MKNFVKCIYCPNELDDSRGKGDHIIPAALGEFRNDLRFRRVCRSCNTKIGACEQQMLQCGPEKIFREIVVPTSKRSRGNRSSYQGAHGMPAPQFRAITSAGVLEVQPMDAQKRTSAPDQLIIYTEQGDIHTVKLFQGISPTSLKKKVRALRPGKIKETRLSCDEAHYESFLKIIQEAWPDSKEERLPPTEPGIQVVPHEITVKVTNLYFRAIAKIAFHYYLVSSYRAKGYEDCFSEVREFIMTGGDKKKFFSAKKRFQDIDAGYLPSRWVHLLAASEKNGEAIAYVCLFKGPESKGIEYQLNIGKLPHSPIIIPKQVWAHKYEYDKPLPQTGKVGTVHSIQVTRQ